MENVDFFLNHRHLKRSHLTMMERAINDVVTKIIEKILEEYGENDLGETNSKIGVGQTVWAAETAPRGEPNPMMKNVSG